MYLPVGGEHARRGASRSARTGRPLAQQLVPMRRPADAVYACLPLGRRASSRRSACMFCLA
jgi:hypothetical protein